MISRKGLTWEYLAGYFDASGSLSEHHTRGKGWQRRLRVSGYDRELLEEVASFLGRGSISQEEKAKGPYYRFEINSLSGVLEVLAKLTPHLRTKKVLVEKWVEDLPHC